jgi:8-oxo-dGTP pyrophosphatase MutT (NUDIX family)
MPHLHTQPGQHDPTASAYIVRTDFGEPKLMLHRHKKLKRFLQFGGHIEHNENPWAAIVHELAEETGYDIDQLKLLQPSERLESLTDAVIHPMPVYVMTHEFSDIDHYHTDIAFAFITDQPPEGSLKEGESKAIELFTAGELRQLPAAEIPESVREAGLYVLDICTKNWVPTASSNFS